MWDLGSRGFFALISVPSGCVFLYNVWGPILVVTISFFLVVYACCSLIVNDTLLSPHAFLVYDYCQQAAIEVRAIFESIVDHVYQYIRQFWESARNRYSEYRLIGMERRRGNNYQLSSDSCSSTRNSSRFGMIGQLSPIPRSTYKSVANKFYHDSDNPPYNHSPRGGQTSTPMHQANSAETENRMLELHSPSRNSPKKGSPPMHMQNHTLTRGENSTYFSPEGSPWGTSISPKMRPKAGGVKTVQTVAGPLLASTRYNIDSKVYNDVTSPGLTTRLTKYATEANKKLTHQAQYGTGQFPKVRLQASPIPLRNVKSPKMRMPSTIRIEPPSNTHYSPLLWKDKILSPPSSASQVLRDKAVKRQASREDVPDLVKKQRPDGIVYERFEAVDETKQKRSRDDSSKSEEDISPLDRMARRVKRTKTRSCYDILNSFSSSKNVASGVKRKAMDFSRSGTPDFEKHFKSLESVSAINVQALPQPENIEIKYCKHDATEKPVRDAADVPGSPSKFQEHSPIKGILKSSGRALAINTNMDISVNSTSPQTNKTVLTEHVSDKPVKLTDKLFMRAEPQRNEKYRLLIEEQGNIKSKFTTNDVEEIKKEDIVNMRKTSMKARLQSMFDAISGKGASRINPDVVIQAEEVTSEKPSVSPVTCATLNSSTTTTNVNTTPISTSAVVPVSESSTKSPKHVAFNIPDKECTPTSSIQISTSERPSTSNPKTKNEDSPIAKLDSLASKPVTMFTTSSGATTTPSISQNNVTSPSISTPKFGFGNLPASTATTVSSSGVLQFGAASSSATTIVSTPSATLPATTATTASFGTPFGFNSSGNVPQNAFGSFPSSQQKTAISNETIGTSASPTQSNSMSSTTIPAFSSSIKNIPSTLSSSSATTTASFTFGTSASTTANAKNDFPFGTTTKSTATTTSETTNTVPVFHGASNAIGSFGTSLTASSTPQFGSNSKSIFGNTTSAPIFGSTKTQTASTTPSTTGAFGGFGIQKTVSAPMFGSNANASSSGMTPVTGTTSGTMTTSSLPAPTPVSVPVPTFGSNSSNTTGSTVVSPSSTLFSNAHANINANLSTTMTTTPTTTAFATTGNIFGQTKPMTSSFVTASAPIFGNNTTSLFGSQTTPVSTFSSANVTSTIITPTFGTTSVGSSATVPAFGTATNTSKTTPAFGTPNVVVTAAQKPTPVTQAFGTGTPMFGTDTTPTSVFRGITAGTFSTFGTAANNTQQLTFGDNKATTPFGGAATSVPTFGAGTSVTSVPAFGGGTNVTPIPAFGSTTSVTPVPAFGSTTSVTPVPAFGSTTSVTTAPAFGSTTSGTAVPTFGEGTSATAVPAFGAPTNNATPLTFGGAPTATSSAPAFGATSSNSGNNNNSNIFTFGGSKPSSEQSSGFPFTSNQAVNNNATPSMSTTFQFGATTSKPVAGFNFAAPTTTPSVNFGAATGAPPVFNAAAPRMFSIGSGTTAPRSRNVRSRRPK